MRQEIYKKIFFPFLTLLLLIGLWSLISQKIEDFPSPTTTYMSAFGGIDSEGDEIEGVLSDPFYIDGENDKGLFWQVMMSLQRVFGGFIISILVGIPIGLLIGMSKNAMYALEPFVQMFKPISPLAWLPLLLFIFKDIDLTAMSTIFITSIWPIIINTALGVKSVSEDYMNVAKVLRFTNMEKITKIILPVAIPYIFTGMRLSLGIAWLVIVAAEMLTGGIGLGFWIWDEYNNLNYANIIIGIFIVGIVGFILDLLMGLLADYFDYRKKV